MKTIMKILRFILIELLLLVSLVLFLAGTVLLWPLILSVGAFWLSLHLCEYWHNRDLLPKRLENIMDGDY